MEVKLVKPKVILCKVTSRGRPEELIKCIRTYLDLANDTKSLKWLFSFDVDDTKYNSLGFIDSIRGIVQGDCTICFGHSNSKIHAINRDIESYSVQNEWDILLTISDDMLAVQKGWDDSIRSLMPNSLDYSLWFKDGRQDRLNTIEIQGRKYFERFKYIYYPEYKSFFCDNEAHEVAEKLGKLIKTNQNIITHFHYNWASQTHMKHDETYIKAEKHWGHDEALYNKRKANGFENIR